MRSTLRSIPKSPSLFPALQPYLNQIRLNDSSSNVQIKPNQIFLDEKENNKIWYFRIFDLKDQVIRWLLNSALTRRKFNKIFQRLTIILEGYCNLHNWFQSSRSSLMVVPAWFRQFLVCNNPLSFFNHISPRFGMMPNELIINTNRNL